MTNVSWSNLSNRTYETGIDRGMFYDGQGPGVAWDGLISVTERATTTLESVYYDGSKLNDIAVLGDYEGTITAYQYPEGFEAVQGVTEDNDGVLITGQSFKTFCFSYRTQSGTAVDGLNSYRIHLVYNAIALPTDVVHNTISDDTDAIEFTWDVSAVPERLTGSRPTAHIMLDSSKIDPYLLSDIEDILYGHPDGDPTCPPIRVLLALIEAWGRLIIIDNDDGTWTAVINRDGDYTDLGSEEFSIEAQNVVTIDADTYQVSSDDKITEDIS